MAVLLTLFGLIKPLATLASGVWTWLCNPSHWPLAIILVLAVALWFDHAALGLARAALMDPATHQSWKAEAAAAQAGLATCKGQSAALTASLGAQNRAIAALKADSNRRLAQLTADAKLSHLAAATAQKQAAIFAAARPGPDVCQSAFDLVHGAVQP